MIIIYNNRIDVLKSFTICIEHLLVRFSDRPEVVEVLNDIKVYQGDIFDLENESTRTSLGISTEDKIALVSPGNSLGIMSGGFDLAVVRHFSSDIELDIQSLIKDRVLLTPGSSVVLDLAHHTTTKSTTSIFNELIYTPTMVYPMELNEEDSIPYTCTLNALNSTKANVVALPLFGIATGGLGLIHVLIEMFVAIIDRTIISKYRMSTDRLKHIDLVHISNILNRS